MNLISEQIAFEIHMYVRSNSKHMIFKYEVVVVASLIDSHSSLYPYTIGFLVIEKYRLSKELLEQTYFC